VVGQTSLVIFSLCPAFPSPCQARFSARSCGLSGPSPVNSGHRAGPVWYLVGESFFLFRAFHFHGQRTFLSLPRFPNPVPQGPIPTNGVLCLPKYSSLTFVPVWPHALHPHRRFIQLARFLFFSPYLLSFRVLPIVVCHLFSALLFH